MKTLKKIKDDIIKIAAHYRSGKDSKHDGESEDIPTFFAHFKSEKDSKHNIKDELKEGLKGMGGSWVAPKSPSTKSPVENVDKEQSMAGAEHHKHIKLSAEHKGSVATYTHMSRPLNNALHGGDALSDKGESQVKDLDAVTSHKENSLKHNITTYSGVSKNFGDKLSKVKNGGKVKSPAYISSSLDHDTAFEFAHTHEPEGTKNTYHRHMIVFHLPKGHTKARSIDHVSKNSGEDEVLHARGQTFKKVGEHTETKHHRSLSGDVVNSAAHVDMETQTYRPGRPKDVHKSFIQTNRKTTYHHLVPTED